MSKGTRAFRIIICCLLGITMLWTGLMSYAFIYVTKENEVLKGNERYGIYVAGIDVTRANAYDILGDGTVSYNHKSHTLTLENADITCKGSVIYSEIDLTVELIGENKFTCGGKELTYGLYASDRSLRKDLAITGDGSLEITVADNGCRGNAGIIAETLWLRADVSVILADAEESSVGISCTYLNLDDEKNLAVKAGAAESSTGIYAREGMCLDKDSAVIVLGAAAEKGSYGIECGGNITAKENAAIQSDSGSERAGIVCYGAFLDGGAHIQAEIEAIGGIYNMK